jgi:hypothetical protein
MKLLHTVSPRRPANLLCAIFSLAEGRVTRGGVPFEGRCRPALYIRVGGTLSQVVFRHHLAAGAESEIEVDFDSNVSTFKLLVNPFHAIWMDIA